MKSVKDLTGMIFGNLEVLEFAYIKNHNAHWKCKCSCENHTEIIVSSPNLLTGHTKSCGCLKQEIGKKLSKPKQNLIGQHFGFLEPIEYIGNSNWRCICHAPNCENECVVSTSHLIGKQKYISCGCQKSKNKPPVRYKDLTGMKFGNLEVLYKVDKKANDKHNGVLWHCRCNAIKSDGSVCGNEIDVYSDRLLVKTRPKTHCGCLSLKDVRPKKRSPNFIDRTGQVYGNLIVKELAYIGKDNRAYWKCECSCSEHNIIIVSGHSLSQNKVQSCGCYRKEKLHNDKLADMVGKIFGKLKVTRFCKSENNKRYWFCDCINCGNKDVIVDGQHLRSGHTRTCGCLDIGHDGSNPEHEIFNYIINKFPNLIIEQHNRKMLNRKEIDIYIPSLKLGIEYNGSAYHATENGIHSNLDKYFHRDKFLLAKSKGIHLISVFDKEYEKDKNSILDMICSIISIPNKQFIQPTKDIEYTNNDYDLGEYMKDFGYEEIGQEEPTSFIYGDKFVVYRCGRTIWKKL